MNGVCATNIMLINQQLPLKYGFPMCCTVVLRVIVQISEHLFQESISPAFNNINLILGYRYIQEWGSC